MILIFEGVDLAGKTTLIKAVQRVLLQEHQVICAVLRRGRPLPGVSPLVEYAQPISADLSPQLICDRWHLGEEIYGPLYRDGSRLTRAMRAFIDGLLVGHGATLVHVTADHETLVQRYHDRGEDFLKEDDIGRVALEYALQTNDAEYWRTVDTTGLQPDDLVEVARDLVTLAIQNHHLAQPILDLQTDYVGPPWPSLLLVGDRPANHDPRTYPYGAFTPWPGNSAQYLIDALHDVGLLTPTMIPRIGWVNSEHVPLTRLHLTLGEPPVIALGNEAEVVLRRNGVPVVGKVYHPQYARRFRHSRREEYGESIAKLACQLSR